MHSSLLLLPSGRMLLRRPFVARKKEERLRRWLRWHTFTYLLVYLPAQAALWAPQKRVRQRKVDNALVTTCRSNLTEYSSSCFEVKNWAWKFSFQLDYDADGTQLAINRNKAEYYSWPIFSNLIESYLCDINNVFEFEIGLSPSLKIFAYFLFKKPETRLDAWVKKRKEKRQTARKWENVG